MCTEDIQAEMAGLHRGHVSILRSASTGLGDIIDELFDALTNRLNPHLPVLPALMAMAEAVRRQDFGVLHEHRLVRLPLSVIGSDAVRYRTPVVEWLHESILSFRMAELTIDAVKEALRPHGLCVLFLCSCGVVMGRCTDVRTFYNSAAHQRMDRLRSAIDAAGYPVVQVSSFEELAVPTMDLSANGAEVRLFDRIEQLTRMAARAGHGDLSWIEQELSDFVTSAQSTRSYEVTAA